MVAVVPDNSVSQPEKSRVVVQVEGVEEEDEEKEDEGGGIGDDSIVLWDVDMKTKSIGIVLGSEMKGVSNTWYISVSASQHE